MNFHLQEKHPGHGPALPDCFVTVPGVQDSELHGPPPPYVGSMQGWYTPPYVASMLSPYTAGRTLRSGSDATRLRVPRIVRRYGDLIWSCCAPTLWNGLPSHLRGYSTMAACKVHSHHICSVHTVNLNLVIRQVCFITVFTIFLCFSLIIV